MISGIGIDAVPVARMATALRRTPGLVERVFTAGEREASESRGSPTASFAARFAAKEACRKALREVLRWQDVEVVSLEDGAPSLRVSGYESVTFHVSLTHTSDIAVAVVVAETA